MDNVFGPGRFESRIAEYPSIVYLEMVHEFETHILPAMMRVCRSYLHRLPSIQANTDFESFSRLSSPVPIPASEEEQSSPLPTPFYRFNGYGMRFPVQNYIQRFRKNPILTLEQIPSGVVHPDSRILLFLVRHDK